MLIFKGKGPLSYVCISEAGITYASLERCLDLLMISLRKKGHASVAPLN